MECPKLNMSNIFREKKIHCRRGPTGPTGPNVQPDSANIIQSVQLASGQPIDLIANDPLTSNYVTIGHGNSYSSTTIRTRESDFFLENNNNAFMIMQSSSLVSIGLYIVVTTASLQGVQIVLSIYQAESAPGPPNATTNEFKRVAHTSSTINVPAGTPVTTALKIVSDHTGVTFDVGDVIVPVIEIITENQADSISVLASGGLKFVTI